MEKQSKAPMIYGYAVCLVAVITFIICIAGLVNAVMDLSDPLHAGWNFNKQPSLASFENYKMDVLSAKNETTFNPDDETLRSMYEAAKADKIQSVKHSRTRDITVNGLLIVICIVLFTTHFLWMRRLHKQRRAS
jgi:hypothetical protein